MCFYIFPNKTKHFYGATLLSDELPQILEVTEEKVSQLEKSGLSKHEDYQKNYV